MTAETKALYTQAKHQGGLSTSPACAVISGQLRCDAPIGGVARRNRARLVMPAAM